MARPKHAFLKMAVNDMIYATTVHLERRVFCATPHIYRNPITPISHLQETPPLALLAVVVGKDGIGGVRWLFHCL